MAQKPPFRFNPTEPIIFLDTETTGKNPWKDRIVELSALKYDPVEKKIIDRFTTFVNPGAEISAGAARVHGITKEMIADAPSTYRAMKQFYEFSKGAGSFIAYNASFDMRLIEREMYRIRSTVPLRTVIDPLKIVKSRYPQAKQLSFFEETIPPRSRKLGDIASYLGIEKGELHRAEADTELVRQLWEKLNPTEKEIEEAILTKSKGRIAEKVKRKRPLKGQLSLFGIKKTKHNPPTPFIEELDRAWDEFASLHGIESTGGNVGKVGSSGGGWTTRGSALLKKVPKKYLLGVGIGVGIYGAGHLLGSLFSGRGSAYNDIEGLRHEGVAGYYRRLNTDFGSGYQGIIQSMIPILDDIALAGLRIANRKDPDLVQAYLQRMSQVVPRPMIPGFDDEYNTIEGLKHKGFAGATRRYMTDFGSGLQPNFLKRISSGISRLFMSKAERGILGVLAHTSGQTGLTNPIHAATLAKESKTLAGFAEALGVEKGRFLEAQTTTEMRSKVEQYMRGHIERLGIIGDRIEEQIAQHVDLISQYSGVSARFTGRFANIPSIMAVNKELIEQDMLRKGISRNIFDKAKEDLYKGVVYHEFTEEESRRLFNTANTKFFSHEAPHPVFGEATFFKEIGNKEAVSAMKTFRRASSVEEARVFQEGLKTKNIAFMRGTKTRAPRGIGRELMEAFRPIPSPSTRLAQTETMLLKSQKDLSELAVRGGQGHKKYKSGPPPIPQDVLNPRKR